MPGFAAWLYNFNAADPALGDLKIFVRDNASTWPYWSEDLAHYLAILSTAPQAQRTTLENTLRNYHARWQAETKRQTSGTSWLADNGGKIVLVFFGLAFMYLLQKGITLETLDNAEQVRGMVTFFFVLVTTSIILLVALGIFWLQDDNAVKVRFEAAKDLLTIVIGVLGTIMGFYFGSATLGSGNLTVTGAAVAPISEVAGKPVTLSANILGGAKPYTYKIVLTNPANAVPADALGKAIEGTGDGKSDDGKITKVVKVPENTPATVVHYTLSVTDSKGASAQNAGAFFVEPKK